MESRGGGERGEGGPRQVSGETPDTERETRALPGSGALPGSRALPGSGGEGRGAGNGGGDGGGAHDGLVFLCECVLGK